MTSNKVASNMSVKVTLNELECPVAVTVITYCIESPAITEVTLATFSIMNPQSVMIGVISVDELIPVFLVSVVMFATFTMIPLLEAFTKALK